MPNSQNDNYRISGPGEDHSVKASPGIGPGENNSNQKSSLAEKGSSSTEKGPGISKSERDPIEDIALANQATINKIGVKKKLGGTTQLNISIADRTPTTGPDASKRTSAAIEPLNPDAIGILTGWVQIGDRYKYYKEDGSGFITGWYSEDNADGTKTWYYFYEDEEKYGIMAANHMVFHTDKKYYYVGINGAMLTSTTFQSEEDKLTYMADDKGGVYTRREK